MILQGPSEPDILALLPDDVPVEMPDLPISLVVNTHQQFKAFGDPVRERILRIIQNQPATAKQIADKLKIPPGTVGHHLQVLEEAGLARVVARRLVHGIVAKYYTRTARIFRFEFPSEIQGNKSISLDFMSRAHEELAESIETVGEDACVCTSFPHVRLSPELVKVYQERLNALLDDLLVETPGPDGQVYGLIFSLFVAPPYVQNTHPSPIEGSEEQTK